MQSLLSQFNLYYIQSLLIQFNLYYIRSMLTCFILSMCVAPTPSSTETAFDWHFTGEKLAGYTSEHPSKMSPMY